MGPWGRGHGAAAAYGLIVQVQLRTRGVTVQVIKQCMEDWGFGLAGKWLVYDIIFMYNLIPSILFIYGLLPCCFHLPDIYIYIYISSE